MRAHIGWNLQGSWPPCRRLHLILRSSKFGAEELDYSFGWDLGKRLHHIGLNLGMRTHGMSS
eukprot:782496-Amphidinium_carterae.2